MAAGPTRSLSTMLRRFGLVALWALTAALMAGSWVRDPYDPTRLDTHRYGHNWDGALSQGIVVSLVELAVLHLVLQPWKRERSGLWVLFALVLLVPWTLMSAIACMHAGGIAFIHLAWLLLVVFALVGALVASGVNAVARARAER